MISSSDVGLIMHDYCKAIFDMPILLDPKKELGEIDNERVVVHVHKQSFGKVWAKCYTDINICVPDEDNGEIGLARLQELERLSQKSFKDGCCGTYDGDTYIFEYDSIGIEEDPQMRCHFVNIKLLFKTQNFLG